METKPKYMDDYSYYDWAKFMVREPKERPKGPHFAAVLFDTENRWEVPYDRDDVSRSYLAHIIHYFAFPDKETLREWLLRATKKKKQFFFFEVKKLGEVEFKVNVDVEL